MTEDPKTILSRWSGMIADRSAWDNVWQEVADFAMPRKGNITRQQSPGNSDNPANALYDTTAIDAAATLAAGHSSAITPAGTQWFAWEAPDEIKSDEADSWYASASEIALKVLTASNFYTALNEAFEDRAGFGICNLGIMPSAERIITFQAHPVGSYCIEEDAEGNVDTIFLRLPFSIRQIVQRFGEQVVAENPKLAKSWDAFKAKGVDSEHWLIHAIFPRLEGYDLARQLDPLAMKFASIWVAEDGKTTLSRSGFPEMPHMASRYLKRTGSKQQYGYGPFEQVRAAIHDAQKIKQILRVVGQKIAVPPIIVPDTLVGNIDTRPGGKTVVRGNGQGMLPQEWLTKGNPDGLFEQLQDARETIRAAFHTDLFRMFSEREKQMTAREVAELAAEKLMPFSPSFTRFTADFQVGMERIFAILYRAGKFGKPNEIPKAVVKQVGRLAEVPPPKVVYQSRIALAIRQAESAAADRMIERAAALVQVSPDALDNIDLDKYVRIIARNEGVPEDMLRKESDRDKMREARAEANAEQRQLEQAKIAAEAAGKVGINAEQMMQ